MKKQILLNGVIVGEYESTGNVEEDMQASRTYLQEKGLWKEVSINDSMFGQANAFAETANLLYRKDLAKSPYKGSTISPFVVNACFSIEIYLKTIHQAYGQSITGHDLYKLFKELSDEAREIVEAAARDVRHRYSVGEKTTIETCLSDLSAAFINWRYIYEHRKLSTDFQSIRYAMHTLFEAARRVRETCA